MLDKQIQKAGDNSQQLQADSMVVNFGIDEKRAREIYQEMNLQLRKEYSGEAFIIASKRISEFENSLVPKMEAIEGALQAFADPSFQLLLVEAQKTAASTERPADYDLLSELLIHRFQRGSNRVTRAGITRAVEIVDEISDDALLGLTVFYTVNNFAPSIGYISYGLTALNNSFEKILYGNLPTGNEWLDHLDILDTIRVNHTAKLNTIEQYHSIIYSGYLDVGIEKNSEDHNKAIKLLKDIKLSEDTLIVHELNSDYVRLPFTSKEKINSFIVPKILNNGQIINITVELSEDQKKVIKSIYESYKIDANLKQQNAKTFMARWDNEPNLKKLREWYDNLGVFFQVTSVGKILAHSNLLRCDKSFPAMK